MNNTYSHLVENTKQLARDAKLRPNSNKSKKARSVLRKIIPDSKIPWKYISHHQILSKLAQVFNYKSWNDYVLFLKNYDRKLEQQNSLLADHPFKTFRDDKISYDLFFNILKNNINFKNWSDYLKFYKTNYPLDRVVASNIKIFGANFNPLFFLEKNISYEEYIELRESIKKFGYFGKYLCWLIFIKCDFILCDFSNTGFRNTIFLNSNLKFCRFSDKEFNSDFENAHFFFCNLEGISATKSTTMGGSIFYLCNLRNADFSGGYAGSPNFYNSNLEYANFKNKDFGGGTSFRKCNLKNSDFRKSNVTGDFRGADIRNAKGLDLSKIIIDNTTIL